MSIRQVSKSTAKIETCLNWGPVVHGPEIMFLNREDHEAFENLVAHEELFASARDVTVVMEDSHA